MERTITTDNLKTLLDKNSSITLLDVRRAEDRAKEPVSIPGATWNDPTDIDNWKNKLDSNKNIILYCVRGGSVSNSVVDALQAKGLNARFIEGGFEAWKAASGEVKPSLPPF